MRMQIVELPRKTVDDAIPFLVVFDQVSGPEAAGLESARLDIAQTAGARGVLVFHDTIEVPER